MYKNNNALFVKRKKNIQEIRVALMVHWTLISEKINTYNNVKYYIGTCCNLTNSLMVQIEYIKYIYKTKDFMKVNENWPDAAK